VHEAQQNKRTTNGLRNFSPLKKGKKVKKGCKTESYSVEKEGRKRK